LWLDNFIALILALTPAAIAALVVIVIVACVAWWLERRHGLYVAGISVVLMLVVVMAAVGAWSYGR